MKKKTFITLAFLAISCTFFITGCDDDEEEHTDPSFLIGTWSNEKATFTIDKNYEFACDISSPFKAKVYGKLDPNGTDMGPNDYILRNMKAEKDGVPDDSYTEGNATIRKDIANFQNIVGTLTPSSDKRQFTFKSTNFAADAFFGGTYNKQ
ncbi:MAG: hypothetical protein LBQ82_04135 [Treponema sp.]|jgi:hypothetical protein|nr:hypothetical protein [Treponema sp.]